MSRDAQDNGENPVGFTFADDPMPVERWRDFALPEGTRKDEYAALIPPSRFSWRGNAALAPVSQQHPYNTCVAHACCNMLETVLAKTGNRVQLDAECLHQCMMALSCNMPVAIPSAVLGAIMNPGAPLRSHFVPGQPCPPAPQLVRATNGHRIGSTQDMKLQISRAGPVVAIVTVDGKFNAMRSLTPYRDTPRNGSIYDHAVLIVGYDDDDQGGNWLIQNSYGTSWGEGGFGRIAYGEAAILADNSHPVLCIN